MFVISLIVLTKNGSQDLPSLLPALFCQKDVPPYEVIAIDSGSTDDTVDLLKGYPLRLQQIPAAAFHHARTRNYAATLASGEILVFLSQDAVPSSNIWLNRLTANFRDSQVGAVYGRQLSKPGSFAERKETFDSIYGEKKLVKDPANPHSLGYRFYLFSDANAAVRKSVWQATGFPEDLKVFEDIGIAKRIFDKGWKIVYEPEATVIHSHNHTTSGLFRRYFDLGYTLKRLKIWDAPGIRQSLARDAWKMLGGKFRNQKADGQKVTSGAGVHKDLAKSFGLLLGVNQSYLPLALKRHLSALRLFG